MFSQSPYQTFKRYRTLQTHRITAMPFVILMPHSACNCRCIMCDIWKDNKNLKQLTTDDISAMLSTLKKLDTRMVVMSGGEALLNPNFFTLCKLLKKEGLKICLLSTGISLAANAAAICQHVDEVIVSLDGDPNTHNHIRNIPNAFEKMEAGVTAIRAINPGFKITARTVIHRLNYKVWPQIITTAMQLGLQQVSFLPADVSSHAFNREVLWADTKQQEIAIEAAALPELKLILDTIITTYSKQFSNGFIAESPQKLGKIYQHYAALNGLAAYPFKKCNAPWVSTVVEADGTVRPCFFHEGYGNTRDAPLDDIINSKEAIEFRKNLNIATNETCVKCVCYLNLKPGVKV
jgi:Fe-coproporphyrin III synthase